ncbi:amidase [Salipiger abyssi]|uniref:amidase n=1 Tax=Salipiger abyssi TaxID=1250539 RepID=UPI001A8C74DD|nr:amidase [Salipiger abyssi]MBN9889366.1 amidase [Salipiger abyssi]
MTIHTAAETALVRRLSLGGTGPDVVVKDCIDIAGTVTACGSEAFAEAPPAAAHATVVEALLAAGCHITGKARMHELAFGMTGVNAFFGTPVNPRWPDRIPGGSSSGSAVAVAAGLCDFAVGTDTGGSVRQPATCCGVFGIKPSFGRISRRGLLPRDSTLDCVGAFARDMGMLQTAMAAMDPGFARASLDSAPKLTRIDAEAAPEVSGPLDAALTDLPHEKLPHLEAAFAAGMTVISRETVTAFGDLLDTGAPLGTDIRARLTAAHQVTDAQLAEAEAVRRRFTAEVDALLERYDALITPALPVVPPTLEAARDPQSILPLTRFLRPFNLSGHPALTLPALSASGLPIGLQLVGRKGEDARLCAIAEWLVASLPLFQSKDQSR